jgi:hypothetical protein
VVWYNRIKETIKETNMANGHTIARLLEIKDEMKELLDEAHGLMLGDENDHFALRRAESYWYAHIRMALDTEHGYLGGSMCSMQNTIDELIADNEAMGPEEFDDTYDWAAENQDLVHRAKAPFRWVASKAR